MEGFVSWGSEGGFDFAVGKGAEGKGGDGGGVRGGNEGGERGK